MCSTKTVDIFEYPHALSPKANKTLQSYVKKLIKDYKKKLSEDRDNSEDEEDFNKVVDYRIDYEDLMVQVHEKDCIDNAEYKQVKEKFSLYPFADLELFKINNSFYGRSDIKSLIPSQKGINFALSMMLKCMENNAYNKVFAKEDALQGQELTNEPGQVVIDYSKFTNGWGVKFAESQPMPNSVIDFVDRFIGLCRVFGGFNDVMDGSVSNQDISGYAIQQMIKQANSSIEQQQQLFWKFCKDKAAIRLTFYKHYVDKAKYTYDLEEFEVSREEESREKLKQVQMKKKIKGETLEIGDVPLDKPTVKTKVCEISGKEMYGSNFDIAIDVMQGTVDSKLVEAQMWDTLLMNGGIQNMDPEILAMYIEVNPNVSDHTRHAIKSIVDKQRKSENTKLKQQLAQAAEYIQKLLEYSKELEAQNGYKKNYIDNLTKEFTNKINVANKVIANKTNQTQPNGVTVGEGKSLSARGIPGADIVSQ